MCIQGEARRNSMKNYPKLGKKATGRWHVLSKPYFNRVLKNYLISRISLRLTDSLLLIKGQYSVCYKITWSFLVRSNSDSHPLEKIISKVIILKFYIQPRIFF